MQYKTWVFCMMCERAFEAHFSRDPKEGGLPMEQYVDLEMQFGRTEHGQVHASCPYEDCRASLMNMRWWEQFSKQFPGWPESPEPDVVYPFH